MDAHIRAYYSCYSTYVVHMHFQTASYMRVQICYLGRTKLNNIFHINFCICNGFHLQLECIFYAILLVPSNKIVVLSLCIPDARSYFLATIWRRGSDGLFAPQTPVCSAAILIKGATWGLPFVTRDNQNYI